MSNSTPAVTPQPASANESAAAVKDATDKRRQEIVDEAAETKGPSTEIVEVESGGRFLMDLSTSPIAFDNFKGDAMERFAMVNLATGPECHSGSENIGIMIRVVYYYVHPVMIAKDADSTPVKVPRVVLIDDGGQAYAFCSQGICDSLQQMLICLDGKIPAEGIPMTVAQIDTRHGRRTYKLVYSPEK